MSRKMGQGLNAGVTEVRRWRRSAFVRSGSRRPVVRGHRDELERQEGGMKNFFAVTQPDQI